MAGPGSTVRPPAFTIAGLLRHQATVAADHVAIAFPDIRYTYGELLERATTLARSLAAHGVGPGRRVGVFLPNCPEYIDLFFATSLLGAQLVPINARFKRRELSYVIANSEITVLITSSRVAEHVDFPTHVAAALPDLAAHDEPVPLHLESAPELRAVVVLGESAHPAMLAMTDFLAAGEGTLPLPGDDPADDTGNRIGLVLYTSGTASVPKGCQLTDRALIGAWWAYARAIDLAADTPLWSPCPMFHVGGLGPLTSALAVGATYVTAGHFEADAALEHLLAEGATHLFPAFPAMTLGILRSPRYTPERFATVRTVLNVAPPDTQGLIATMLPDHVVLLTDFGMTEAAGIVTFTPATDPPELRWRTNGVPFPGLQVRITDEADGRTELPSGHEGEIQFRGMNAFSGYLNDPAATAATILADGWVRTGDRGRLAATGHLNYVGRTKDMLKIGGENVAPAEIEALLSVHPAVAMAQVIGRPDDKYGEVAVAFVELLPGHACTEAELVEHCRGEIASFKLPREVRFVTEWPMSATKIQKFRLRELV